jgi:hypothetical protein
MKNKKLDPGYIGDEISDKQVFPHDQLKARCQTFLTELTINHSPKELTDFLFEMIYDLNTQSTKSNSKRIDIFMKEFYDEWAEKQSKEKD